MAPEEVALMSTSSTQAEMMPHVMMIAPWAAIENVGTGESVAGSVTVTRTENVEGPVLVNAVDVPVPGSERGRETDRLEERKTVGVAGVETESGIAGAPQEETAGVGRGVENGRKGAGAGTARETEREARGWMERRPAKGMEVLRVVTGSWRNMKAKWVRAWRNVETGTEKGTKIEGAATGTETDAEETEIGSTRESEEKETGETAGKSAILPYEKKQSPKTAWEMRMRVVHHHVWRNTIRME